MSDRNSNSNSDTSPCSPSSMISNEIIFYDTSTAQVIDLFSSNPLYSIISNQENYQKFFQNHFQHQPVVFRGNIDRINDIKETLFDLDILEMIQQTASDKIHIWLSSHANHNSSKKVMDSISLNDAKDAYKLHQLGHSLYCRAPAEFESKIIPSFLQSLGFGIKGCQHDKFFRGEIETFYSRCGHITAYHTDFQENFTIVLSGKKLWSFQSSTAQYPLRGCSPHFSSSDQIENTNIQELQLKTLRLGNHTFYPDEYLEKSSTHTTGSDTICSVELSAGDVLYHPAGVWHRVECLEDSISINISLISASYAELFCSSLQQLLSYYPQFRQPINTSHPEESFKILQGMLDLLPQVSQGLIPSDILPPLTLHGSQEVLEDTTVHEKEEIENESGDEESEGDEAVEEVVLSLSSLEYPDDFLPHLSLHAPKKHPLDITPTHIRRNPLATLISSSDINRYNHTETSSSYDETNDSSPFYVICHSGYGNEHYESTNRVKIVIDTSDDEEDKSLKRIKLLLKLILEKCLSLVNTKFPTIPEQFPLHSTEIKASNIQLLDEFVTLIDIPSLVTTLPPPPRSGKKSSNKSSSNEFDDRTLIDLLKKTLYSFHLAGVITFQCSHSNSTEEGEKIDKKRRKKGE